MGYGLCQFYVTPNIRICGYNIQHPFHAPIRRPTLAAGACIIDGQHWCAVDVWEWCLVTFADAKLIVMTHFMSNDSIVLSYWRMDTIWTYDIAILWFHDFCIMLFISYTWSSSQKQRQSIIQHYHTMQLWCFLILSMCFLHFPFRQCGDLSVALSSH